MTITPPLVGKVLDAISTALPLPLDTPHGPAPDPGPGVDALRVLAVLVPVVREALDRAASAVGSSPVRAAAFLRLSEEIYRQAGYGQLLAVSQAGDAGLHTITEDPLAALNEALRDPAAFAAGAGLPEDAPARPGCKPLYRDDTDFLAAQLNLTHFQAQHRVQSAGNLLPHIGFNGRKVPPKFPLLGRVLTDAAADPKAVATLAKKFEALAPNLAEGDEGTSTARELEAELADAARTRNAQGTAKLLKDQAKRLNDEAAATAREAVEDLFVGAYYLGHTRKGYEYKVITTAEGHELLATAADILNSPKTKAGTPAAPAPEAGPPIPEWAIDPNIPVGQRPTAGFTDLGIAPELDPTTEIRPGETIEQALTRQRARRLHQFFLDALRIATSPVEPGAPEGNAADAQMPLAPNFTMNITINLETFMGQLDAAGVTDHGEDISAASCRRIACNAGIVPIVLDGAGVPLELGRTRRYFNRAQRRAIAVRDKGCANPGCTMPPNRCEAHHLDAWNLGGRTDVSRGCLLCPICHQAYHAGKFRIEMIRGIPHVILPRSRDPLQIPRRNWMFHPAAEPQRAA
ncbi:DUF222 domain-containing protein [Paeniglutamicibacter sp.]|uniref:HNH endonuclease signature motif containing protein n=1 Tax=Paeniglutamicibacter sp. TaxID=1934391 RepID=UPI00398949FF